MRTFIKHVVLLLGCIFMASAESITIAVDSVPQQTFQAAGFSLLRYANPYENGMVTDANRDELERIIYDDLNTKIVKWWHDYSVPAFVNRYVTCRAIEGALKHGVEVMLFGPVEVNAANLSLPRWISGGFINETGLVEHAAKVASDIKELRDNYDVPINATGLMNEPGSGFRTSVPREFWVRQIKLARKELDDRGLEDVKLIGLEWQPPSSKTVQYGKDIGADPEAREAMDGYSTHSYSKTITDEDAAVVREFGWEYWVTEAGYAVSGEDIGARFLADLNHMVTHWVFFIGPHRGGGTHALVAATNPPTITPHYWALKLLWNSFIPGTEMRTATSSADGLMHYDGHINRQRNLKMTAAAGVKPDGRWIVGLSNITGSRGDQHFTFPPAEDHDVTVELPGITGETVFEIERGGRINKIESAGTVRAEDGRISLRVPSGDVLVLTSSEPVVTMHETDARQSTAEGLKISARPCRDNVSIRIGPCASRLSGAGQIALRIYDSRGNQVADLGSRIPRSAFSGKGSFSEVSWKAGKYANGIYAVQFQAPGLKLSEKVLLAR